MYNVSQLFKNLCDSNNREFEMKLIINDEIEIDDSKIFDLEIENSIIAGETYTIGNCIASKLVVEVLDIEDIPLKTKLIPYIRIKDNTQTSEWLQLGVFYVEEKSKTQNRYIYTCYDALFNSDIKYISQKTLPTTTIEILNEIKTLLGIEADTTNIYSYPISYHIDGTIREALSEIAVMNAGNFIVDNTGVLRLIKLPSFSSDSIKDFTGSDYINIQYKNESAELTKLIFTKDSVEYTKGEGTEEKTFYATGREYFINNQFETILNNIYSAISSIKYTPISAVIKAYPYLQVGDKVKFIDHKTNEEIDTYIMRLVLQYSGGLSMQVESKFKANEKIQNTGSVIKRAEKVVEQIKGFSMVKNENPIEVYDTSEVTLLEMPLISLQSADSVAIDTTVYIQGILQGGTSCKLSIKLLIDEELIKEFKVNCTNDEDYITIKYLLTNVNIGEYTLKLVAKVETQGVTLNIDKEGCCLYIRCGQQLKPVVKVEGGESTQIIEYVPFLNIFHKDTLEFITLEETLIPFSIYFVNKNDYM
ncbi:MAG: hypothetical protein N2486_02130 [Caloramator sp.]|nr:hypothetical protein [Caloramator sp.]